MEKHTVTNVDEILFAARQASRTYGLKGDDEFVNTPDGEVPNEYERSKLRLVSDKIPLSAWLVCIVETAERFSYYGTAGPLQNYMQNPYGSGLRPGALGLGQANASSIWYGFNLYMFVTPLVGGVIADSWLGRYRTICWGVAFQLAGLLIIFLTSLPYSLEHGAGLGGLIATLVLLGTASGGIKSNVSAFQVSSTGASAIGLPDLPCGKYN
ncbi:hypothetical protein TruAng_004391 [Truncatella angustata]|nr:hypothetical protein TruAng_004391 [Truncatella angustata]